MRFVVAMLAALIVAPAALAWIPISPALPGSMRPSVAKLRSNTELVAYGDRTSTLRVISSGSGTHTIATGLSSVGQPAIVQTNSAEELYAPAALADGSMSGVLRWESKNDGFTWSGPFKTTSTSLADITAATVRADGTPVFIQGSKIYQGVNGELAHTVSGSLATVAVDSTNRALVTFWSKNHYAYQSLDKTGAPVGKPVALPHTVAIGGLPTATDASGDTFAGWVTSAGFTVGTFKAGKLVRSTVVAAGKQSAPHLALAVDPTNHVWAIWSQGATVSAKLSTDGGKTFGAAQSASGSASQIAAAAPSTGQVHVFANDGHELAEQTFSAQTP